jgi:hypothetical protein
MSAWLMHYLLAHGQYVWAEFHRYHHAHPHAGWLEWYSSDRPQMGAHTTCVAHLSHNHVVLAGEVCK